MLADDDMTPKQAGTETSETEYSEWDPQVRERKRQKKRTVEERNANTTLKPDKPEVILEADTPWAKKKQSIKKRVFWSTVMVGGFMVLIAMGHLYVAFLVTCLTMGMFREIIELKRNVEKDNKIPLFLTLRWYFFCLAEYGIVKRLIGSTHLDRLIEEYGGPFLYKVFVQYHTFTIYLGFIAGVIFFVLSLRKFTLRYQFHQLGWTILTILLIVMQSCAHLSNIYAGIVWFLLSTTLVITNDIFAYIVGASIGRTQLIALSPKKTVEGFLGGAVFTCIMAVVAVNILSQMDFFLCPNPTLLSLPFEALTTLTCDQKTKAGFFEQIELPLVGYKMSMLSIHATIMALFASLVAPFGGFFASGFKRAFRIKDFGDLIPGHGGVTDRFDCQIVMGLFCHMYLYTFVYPSTMDLKSVKRAADMLSAGDRQDLQFYLGGGTVFR